MFSFWMPQRDLNPQPSDSESDALPIAPQGKVLFESLAGIEPAPFRVEIGCASFYASGPVNRVVLAGLEPAINWM